MQHFHNKKSNITLSSLLSLICFLGNETSLKLQCCDQFMEPQARGKRREQIYSPLFASLTFCLPSCHLPSIFAFPGNKSKLFKNLYHLSCSITCREERRNYDEWPVTNDCTHRSPLITGHNER